MKILELKTQMTETKKSLEGFNRLESAKEQTSKPEDRSIDIIWDEERGEKKTEPQRNTDTIKHIILNGMGISKGDEGWKKFKEIND